MAWKRRSPTFRSRQAPQVSVRLAHGRDPLDLSRVRDPGGLRVTDAPIRVGAPAEVTLRVPVKEDNHPVMG